MNAKNTEHRSLPEPWRFLYSALIVHGASILQQRHFGDPINQADAERQDDALSKLGTDARLIADAMALAANELKAKERDAARWNMLPAFFEEFQINAMKLYRDIDEALTERERGAL